MSLYLLVRWLYVAGLLLVALLPLAATASVAGTLGTAGSVVADLLFTIVYFVLVDRAVTGFRALRPKFCSIYQPAFWRHERFWKVPSIAYMRMFNGTPFKGVIWRLLGVRIGRRVFDDGCSIIERSLVSVGSGARSPPGASSSAIPSRTASSSPTAPSSGPDAASAAAPSSITGSRWAKAPQLDADSFLMKGEHVPPGARWGGNPATERGRRALPQRAPWSSPPSKVPHPTNRSLTRWTSSKHANPPSAATAASGQQSSAGPSGSWLYDEQGRGYLDFFAGAGALNYGHNNPVLKGALLSYLADDGVIHSLDMYTVAKREFLTVFDELILRPRQLDYRVQFPGRAARTPSRRR